MKSLSVCKFAAVALLALSLPALAVTSSSFKYSNPKTGFLSISPMALAPDSDNSAIDYTIGWNSTLDGNGCYNTGVNLPQGSKILEVSYYQAGRVDANLTSNEVATGTQGNLASIANPPLAASRTLVTFTLPTPVVVRNDTKNYGFGVCLQSGEHFFGARIKYSYANAGD